MLIGYIADEDHTAQVAARRMLREDPMIVIVHVGLDPVLDKWRFDEHMEKVWKKAVVPGDLFLDFAQFKKRLQHLVEVINYRYSRGIKTQWGIVLDHTNPRDISSIVSILSKVRHLGCCTIIIQSELTRWTVEVRQQVDEWNVGMLKSKRDRDQIGIITEGCNVYALPKSNSFPPLLGSNTYREYSTVYCSTRQLI